MKTFENLTFYDTLSLVIYIDIRKQPTMSSDSDSEVEMYSSNDGSDNENSNEIEYKKFEMPNLSGIKNKERRKALHLKYKKMQAEVSY